MTLCPKCGAPSTGAFCVACGTPIPAPPKPPKAPDLPENFACLLCYALWTLTGVLFLLLAPYNKSKLVRFHAWQSITMGVILFAAWFVILFIAAILRLLPWIGVPLALLLVNLFGLVMVGVWLLMMFKAYQGGSLDLPFVSRFAHKQA
jgi:uncharacterized membrane protein